MLNRFISWGGRIVLAAFIAYWLVMLSFLGLGLLAFLLAMLIRGSA